MANLVLLYIIGISSKFDDVANVASNTNRISWSGGDVAKDAAETWAKKNGATTLEMNLAKTGSNLEDVTKNMQWSEAKPLWENVSREFAQGAKGEVHVFQKAEGVSTTSIWGGSEYKALLKNADVNKIVYHVIQPDGRAQIFTEVIRK